VGVLPVQECEAGSTEEPLKIYSLKRSTIPKMAVLATGLTAAILVATINPAPTAQAFPWYGACTSCHKVAGGSVTATPSSATPGPGTSYNVEIDITATAAGKSGYWISGNGVSLSSNTATGSTFSVAMTAPVNVGTYTYTVWVNKGNTTVGQASSTDFSITVTTIPPTKIGRAHV